MTSKDYLNKFRKLDSIYQKQVEELRAQAENELLVDYIYLMDKPVKIVGQKGWNIGMVTDVRLGYDFSANVKVKNTWFPCEKIVEPSEIELRKFNLDNKINSK